MSHKKLFLDLQPIANLNSQTPVSNQTAQKLYPLGQGSTYLYIAYIGVFSYCTLFSKVHTCDVTSEVFFLGAMISLVVGS